MRTTVVLWNFKSKVLDYTFGYRSKYSIISAHCALVAPLKTDIPLCSITLQTDTTEDYVFLISSSACGAMEGDQSQEQHDALTWFTKFQQQSVIRNGIVPEWFHGVISRKTAEERLMAKPPCYFLIRVSESRIGYTLSYRAEDRCRHFMIDVLKDGHYIIVGEKIRHRFLQDLVDFHRRTPIMPFCEVLTVPCGQGKTDYADLLFPLKHSSPNTNSLQNNYMTACSMTHPQSQKDIPPALPYRPNNLGNPAVPPLNGMKMSADPAGQPNQLYPSLDDDLSNVTSPLPARPVPLPRKRYTTHITPSIQGPEAPTRSSVPPRKHKQVCTGSISAPGNPSTSAASEQLPDAQNAEHQHSGNSTSVRNQDAKLSVVTNFKKFHKKRSKSQEHAELSAEADESGNTENEYQELTWEQTINGAPFSHTSTAEKPTDDGLPYEYLPPPPFAPGY